MAISTAVDVSAVARVVGIKTNYRDLRGNAAVYLPQRIALIGQGASSVSYSTTKTQYTSANAVAGAYGYGSPLHLAALQFFPLNGDGVGTIPVTVYPLEDDASGVAATGSITPVGTATESTAHRIEVNNGLSSQFVISTGDGPLQVATKIVAAINAVPALPVIAALNSDTPGSEFVEIESKWAGESANAIFMTVSGSTPPVGVTIAVTQVSGGLVNPSVQPALDQIGTVWETLVLNCLNIEDEVALDAIQAFGAGRWGALVRKPLTAWTGVTDTTVANATAISDTRKDDYINGQLVAPGSVDLPFVVAARQLARIAPTANNNPARDYGGRVATGLTPGADGDQWTYADRDQAVKSGSSTVESVDGQVEIGDVVTFYHPTGDELPAYRYLCDIVKISNILFNLDLIFARDDWNGAPLVPDGQSVNNRTAKKPRMAVAEVNALAGSLALEAIISDPDFTRAQTIAGINEQNPKRLDVYTVMKLSGNTNIISVDFDFGFYFGTPTLVA